MLDIEHPEVQKLIFRACMVLIVVSVGFVMIVESI